MTTIRSSKRKTRCSVMKQKLHIIPSTFKCLLMRLSTADNGLVYKTNILLGYLLIHGSIWSDNTHVGNTTVPKIARSLLIHEDTEFRTICVKALGQHVLATSVKCIHVAIKCVEVKPTKDGASCRAGCCAGNALFDGAFNASANLKNRN